MDGPPFRSRSPDFQLSRSTIRIQHIFAVADFLYQLFPVFSPIIWDFSGFCIEKRETDREREKERERDERERQKETDRQRQTDRQRGTETEITYHRRESLGGTRSRSPHRPAWRAPAARSPGHTCTRRWCPPKLLRQLPPHCKHQTTDITLMKKWYYMSFNIIYLIMEDTISTVQN